MEVTTRKSKQVIVMCRTFTINGEKRKLRTGKYCSQSSHASMAAILNMMQANSFGNNMVKMELIIPEDSALNNWLTGIFTKICCSVETEAELVELYNKAKEKGLPCSLIQDAGLTEFGGVPTITSCAIGPAWSDDVDEITGKLELF